MTITTLTAGVATLQSTIAQALGILPQFDVNVEIERRKAFIKHMLKTSGLTTLVLGISGGVDSLTAGRLCQLAVNELNKEHGMNLYEFVAVKLPYRVQRDADMVEKSLAFIQPTQTVVVNIGDAVDAANNSLQDAYRTLIPFPDLDFNFEVDFAKGNIKARTRMIMQYALAGMTSGLVVGTDHASEAVTGFFTKFGDGGFDFTPLGGLVKREVRAIAQALGAPAELYLKTPTADLEDGRPGIPDETALGVPYEDIDRYLKGEPVSDESAKTIETWYLRTQHKRDLPYSPVDWAG